jgi:hypothetical protein
VVEDGHAHQRLRLFRATLIYLSYSTGFGAEEEAGRDFFLRFELRRLASRALCLFVEEVLTPLRARLRVVAEHDAVKPDAEFVLRSQSGIRACSGVRLPLRLLHATHAATRFSGVDVPPARVA